MDLILRNGRIVGQDDQTTVDIGIQNGRIAAIETKLSAEGRELDLQGRLVTPGFIETHIHLDKSCILDRCQSAEGIWKKSSPGHYCQTGVHRRRRAPTGSPHPGKMHTARHHPCTYSP